MEEIHLEEIPPKLSSIQIWTLAARPKTLPAAASVAIVGSAAAFSEDKEAGKKHFRQAIPAIPYREI